MATALNDRPAILNVFIRSRLSSASIPFDSTFIALL